MRDLNIYQKIIILFRDSVHREIEKTDTHRADGLQKALAELARIESECLLDE